MPLSNAHHSRRARAVQSWMAVCVGLGSIGRMVLHETDEAWEHTPEYEGFRPVQGMR